MLGRQSVYTAASLSTCLNFLDAAQARSRCGLRHNSMNRRTRTDSCPPKIRLELAIGFRSPDWSFPVKLTLPNPYCFDQNSHPRGIHQRTLGKTLSDTIHCARTNAPYRTLLSPSPAG